MDDNRTKVRRYRCKEDTSCGYVRIKNGESVEAILLTDTNLDIVKKWLAKPIVVLISESYVLIGGFGWEQDENCLTWPCAVIFEKGEYIVKRQDDQLIWISFYLFNVRFEPEA
ncbi:MAG: hypothetical protein LBW85_01350 [Deltaproteobacteria bacterium]|jgi:hypothetical protein|nr:hypothetical protein [Deltaproteobacteria bacterium]